MLTSRLLKNARILSTNFPLNVFPDHLYLVGWGQCGPYLLSSTPRPVAWYLWFVVKQRLSEISLNSSIICCRTVFRRHFGVLSETHRLTVSTMFWRRSCFSTLLTTVDRRLYRKSVGLQLLMLLLHLICILPPRTDLCWVSAPCDVGRQKRRVNQWATNVAEIS